MPKLPKRPRDPNQLAKYIADRWPGFRVRAQGRPKAVRREPLS